MLFVRLSTLHMCGFGSHVRELQELAVSDCCSRNYIFYVRPTSSSFAWGNIRDSRTSVLSVSENSMRSFFCAVFLIVLFGCYGQMSTPTDRWYAGGSYAGTGPTIGPKGLVFFSTPKTGRGDIFSYEPSAGKVQSVIASAGYDGQPVMSPDGRTLAFVREVGSQTRVFIFDLETGSERQVTWGPGDDFDPSFSVDGRKIAFSRALRKESNYPCNVFAVDLSNLIESQLTLGSFFDRNARFMDGDSIIFVRDLGVVMKQQIDATKSPQKLFDGYCPVYEAPSNTFITISDHYSDERYEYDLVRFSQRGEFIEHVTRDGGYKSNLQISASGLLSYLQEPDRDGLGILVVSDVSDGFVEIFDMRGVGENQKSIKSR